MLSVHELTRLLDEEGGLYLSPCVLDIYRHQCFYFKYNIYKNIILFDVPTVLPN